MSHTVNDSTWETALEKAESAGISEAEVMNWSLEDAHAFLMEDKRCNDESFEE